MLVLCGIRPSPTASATRAATRFCRCWSHCSSSSGRRRASCKMWQGLLARAFMGVSAAQPLRLSPPLGSRTPPPLHSTPAASSTPDGAQARDSWRRRPRFVKTAPSTREDGAAADGVEVQGKRGPSALDPATSSRCICSGRRWCSTPRPPPPHLGDLTASFPGESRQGLQCPDPPCSSATSSIPDDAAESKERGRQLPALDAEGEWHAAGPRATVVLSLLSKLRFADGGAVFCWRPSKEPLPLVWLVILPCFAKPNKEFQNLQTSRWIRVANGARSLPAVVVLTDWFSDFNSGTQYG
jgi:hypothetical protein